MANFCPDCGLTAERAVRDARHQPACVGCGSARIVAAKPEPFVVYDEPVPDPPQWRPLRRRNSTEQRVLQLAARDGWLCHLCGGKINPAERKTAPRGATIDHLAPLSAGGSRRSKANMRLAHKECNTARGNAPLGTRED